ncbi:MAG: CheR family methyltransferase [Phycisphaerales bacterium]
MSGLERWLRSNLPLQPAVLEHAIDQARRHASATRVSESSLLETLQADPSLLEKVLAVAVPPETWLFRHAPAFECARAHLRSLGARKARILSLGCATGAEAFSLAATARETGRDARTCEIVAVDWNRENLSRAAGGTCPPLAQRGPIPAWAARHFRTDTHGSLRLVPEAMAMIRWMHDDITGDRMPRDCDIVFCRNVAIYLDEPARDRLARNLAACTRVGGMLCLGHADPPRLWSGAFRASAVSGAFAHERVDHPLEPPATPATQPALGPIAIPSPPAPVTPASPSLAQAQEFADAGDLDQAIVILEQLVRTNAIDADAWQLLGSVHLARGASVEAEACFRKVVYLHPDHALALLQLGVFAEDRGDGPASERMRARAARALRGDAT